MGILIGLFISLAVGGFIQGSIIDKEITSLQKPPTFKNLTKQDLSPYENYLFEARVEYLKDAKFFFFITLLVGIFGLLVVWTFYNYINKFSNHLFIILAYQRKKGDIEIVDILRELKSKIQNSSKFYKKKAIVVSDEYHDKYKKGKIIFSTPLIGKLGYFIEVQENQIKIECANSKKGEEIRDYFSEIILSKKYSTIKALKEIEKGDFFSFR